MTILLKRPAMPETLSDLGPPIASGNTAELYAWQPGQVLKLFRPGYSAERVQYEAEIARAVVATGLRVPAIYAVVTVGDRVGIVYERYDGVTMMSRLARQPWRLVADMRQMARLHADLHSRPAPTLPPQRRRLTHQIREAKPLPERMRSAALATLDELPDDQLLCHGDFHPENILVIDQDAIVIDWNDATCGQPLADVARTLLLIRLAGLPSESLPRRLTAAVRSLMRNVYLSTYGRRRPVDRALLGRWEIPVAAARLSETIGKEEGVWLRYLDGLI